MTDIVERLRAGFFCREEAADEIERLRRSSDRTVQWQPVETAPKDGQNIILYSDDIGPVVGYWQEWKGVWVVVCSNWETEPRFWQPLPDAPVPSTAREAPPTDLYAWPIGCHSPNYCHRNGRCMYVGCKHDGKDVSALAAAALSVTSTDRGDAAK